MGQERPRPSVNWRVYSRAGKKVMLAAGDTFKAAAVEQLEVWGQRASVPVVKGQPGQDPSSVILMPVREPSVKAMTSVSLIRPVVCKPRWN